MNNQIENELEMGLDYMWLSLDWDNLDATVREGFLNGIAVIEDFHWQDFQEMIRAFVKAYSLNPEQVVIPESLTADIHLISAWIRKTQHPDTSGLSDTHPVIFRGESGITDEGRFARYINNWNDIRANAGASLLRWYCNYYCKYATDSLIQESVQRISNGEISPALTPDEYGRFPHLGDHRSLAELKPWEYAMGMLLVHMSRPWTLPDHKFWLGKELTECISKGIETGLQARIFPPADLNSHWSDCAYSYALTHGRYNFGSLYASGYIHQVTNFVGKAIRQEIAVSSISDETLGETVKPRVVPAAMEVYKDMEHYALGKTMGPYNGVIESWPVMKEVKRATPSLYYTYWFAALFLDDFDPLQVVHPADMANQIMDYFSIEKGSFQWKSLLGIEVEELTVIREKIALHKSDPRFNTLERVVGRDLLRIRMDAGRRVEERQVGAICEVYARMDVEEHHVPVLVSFVRDNGSSVTLRNIVLDWLCDTDYNSLPSNCDWDEYVRLAEEWHTERFERQSEANQYDIEAIRSLLRGDGTASLPEWRSALGRQQVDGFVIVPLTNARELLSAGNVLLNCVGQGRYSKECLEGLSRIFAVSRVTEIEDILKMSLLEIRQHNNKWGVVQHLGIRNSEVRSDHREIGLNIAEMYNRA